MPKPNTTVTLPYSDKEAFLKSFDYVYRTLGYNDEMINAHIQAKMEDKDLEKNYIEANKVVDFMKDAVKFYSKYQDLRHTSLDGRGNMSRVIHAMYKPETSIENIEYNEMLTKRLGTVKGTIEVLQEAVTMLATADPVIFQKPVDDSDKFKEIYNTLTLGWVTKNLLDVINEFKENYGLTENDIPQSAIDHIQKNKLLYESSAYQKQMYERKADYCDLFMPEGLNGDQLFDIVFKGVKEERKQRAGDAEVEKLYKHFPAYIGEVNAEAEMKTDVPDPIPADDEATSFFEDIKARMDVEKINCKDAQKKAEKYEYEVGFAQNLNSMKPNMEAKDPEVGKENKKLIVNRLKNLEPKVQKACHGTMKEAVETLYAALKKGNMTFHTNENYEAMLKTVKDMRELVALDEKGVDVRKKFEESVAKLQDASNNYLNKKVKDNEVFSNTALDRIDAARLCKVFTMDKQLKMTFEKNKEIKAEMAALNGVNINKDYSRDDLKKAFDEAKLAYRIDPTPENLAKTKTYELAYLQQNGTALLGGKDLSELLSQNLKMYTELCKSDKRFEEAIKAGDPKEATRGIQKVVEQQEKEQKQAELQAKEKTEVKEQQKAPEQEKKGPEQPAIQAPI